MKLIRTQSNKKSGFTLVEMIGVLAVIAILASMLVPRVFQAISDSKVSSAASSTQGIKSAVSEYYGKYGKIAGAAGATLTFTDGKSADWDGTVLLPEGLIEKPYALSIGTAADIRVVSIGSNVGTSAIASDTGTYDLDGVSVTVGEGDEAVTTANDVTGAYVVEATITGVVLSDAKDFNNRIDGSALGASSGNDTKGRVKYFVNEDGTTASVRIYLAHR